MAGKVPLPGSRGFHDATTDKAVINAWRWTEADGVGVAVPDGMFVVDIDPRNGGDATIKALVKAFGPLPGTRVHKTKSGGSHRFYHVPDGFDKRLAGVLGPGVDIKAAGKGYVVFPPTPGYEVQSDNDVVEAPEWVIKEVAKPNREEGAAAASEAKFFEQFDAGTEYGKKALEGEVGRLILAEEGGRNNALNRAAFAMAQLVAGGELSEKIVFEQLALAGERMGLEAFEVERTIQSGFEAGLSEPRQSPVVEERAGKFELPVTQASEENFWLRWEDDPGDPPPFYLWPIIPKNAYVTIYGPTEASKSMVILGLCCQGSREGIKSDIYSLENPTHIDIQRTKRFGPNPDFFRITNEMIDFADSEQLVALRDRTAKNGTNILVFDTYSHAFNWRSDDGNAKAIEFAVRVRWLMKETGATVIYLDHTGYQDHGEPRDASAKRQQVDVAIKMKEPTDPWRPKLKSAVFFMDNHKAARFGNPFNLTGNIIDTPEGGLEIKFQKPRDEDQAPKWRNA